MTNDPDIKNLVDTAFQKTAATPKTNYANPDEYLKATNHRYRQTKDEIASFGSSKEGRLISFLARQEAGKLQ